MRVIKALLIGILSAACGFLLAVGGIYWMDFVTRQIDRGSYVYVWATVFVFLTAVFSGCAWSYLGQKNK